MEPKKLKLIAWLSVVGLIVLIGLIWIANHSYIQITTSGGSNSQLVYDFTKVGDKKKTTVKSNSTKLTKLVGKGEYNVYINQGDKTATASIKARGFLGRSKASVQLKSENSRTFVGDNPLPCMFYSNQILYSRVCNGPFSGIYEHVPASVGLPTYTTALASPPVSATLEDMIKTKEGNLALVSQASPLGQFVNVISDDLNASIKSIRVPVSDPLKSYGIQKYKDGFLVYKQDGKQLFYYPSISSSPQIIALSKPKDAALKPVGVSANKNSVMVVYSNIADQDIEDTGNRGQSKVKNTFIVDNAGKTNEFTFNGGAYGLYILCGSNRLCLMKDGNLEVYDISGSSAKLKFKYSDVQNVEAFNDNLLVITSKRVLNVDPVTGQGSVSYSFGPYSYCGDNLSDNGYILCVLNKKGGKSALFIDLTKDNTDSIDKKIVKLQQKTEIIKANIYGHFIHITPQLGQAEYLPDAHIFGYNPATVQSVNSKINEAIDTIGIDRNAYTIINTSEYQY